MEGASLSVENLACRRGERVLFRALSFDLGPGEALQVRGANGTGKSSLMRILAGLLRPLAGTVERRGSVGLLDDRLPLDEHLPLGKAFAFWNRIDETHSPGAFASVGIDALLEIGREQAVERQDRRQQRRDPHHPAAGARQQHRVRPDGEGKQHRHAEEEQHRQHRAAAPPAAERQRQVAAEQGEDDPHGA